MTARIFLFSLGLALLACGISCVTGAALGTGTISALPFVVSTYTGVSMGRYVFAMNLVFFILQSLLDHRSILKRAVLQLPCILFFAVLIDLTLPWFMGLMGENYVLQIGLCFVGAAIIGAGIACTVKASITVLPPEGVALAVQRRWGGSFGTIRLTIDLALVASALLTSYALLGTFVGVREGTVISAASAGPFAGIFLRLLNHHPARSDNA